VLIVYINKNEVNKVNIKGYYKEVDDLITHVVYKATLIKLFIKGYKFVYNTSKIVYNCILNLRLALNYIKFTTNSIRYYIINKRTFT
jgi:hypothetical protein